jgi:XTP/dITP diphosphohydrolase
MEFDDRNHRLVLASGNQGKVREFNQLLAGKHLEVVPQSEFAVTAIEETGLTFIENALLKARHASKCSGLPALADDSGIEVDALSGAPGIRSARYAGDDASDRDNLMKLLEDLRGVPEGQRSARFQCVIVLLRHAADPTPIVCQGTWEGRIAMQPVGDNGFGYDPVFWVPERQCSAAQLSPELKNGYSHRGQALRKLLQKI